MQIRFRSNPKTIGWARRIAIALLAGSAAFALTLPVTFFLLLSHYNHTTPNDPQNILQALTIAVAAGLGLALLVASANMAVAFFLRLGKAAAPAVLS